MAQGHNDLQNEPKLIDGSAPLFSMYNKRVKEHDEKVAESWKGDAEGILVFTGLFSAAVAQLLGSALQNLQPNPQSASSFYLARIYQLTPGSNASSIPLPDDPATFTPPKSAILISTLWSFSLVISLTCALLATLLQQWARRYLRITQKSNDPQKRAQTRELMWRALRKRVRFRWMVEFLPFLLHTSVFLFLVGFVVYLFTFNNLVAGLVAGCAGTSLISYLYVSFAPIFPFFPCSRDSPYSTPLTTVVWSTTMGITALFLRLRHFIALHWSRHWPRFQDVDVDSFRQSYQFYYKRMLKGPTMDVERLAATSSGLATSVLLSTFDSLDGDGDMEQFLSCIPGFYASASAQIQFDQATFDGFNSDTLPSSIFSFMEHVMSSNLLPDPEKENRVAICSRAINANTFLLQSTFQKALQTPNSNIFSYTDFIHVAVEHLRRDGSDPWVKDYAQCVVAIAINRPHLDHPEGAWIDIVERYLELRHAQYRSGGHNLRLCNLIYLTQQLKTSQLGNSDQFEPGKDWYLALFEARKLEVRGTALELQRQFRALWHEILGAAQGHGILQENASRVIGLLRPIYDDLDI